KLVNNRSARTGARIVILVLGLIIGISHCLAARGESADDANLPSWNEGPVKQEIVDFVNAVTDKDRSSYVPPEERIATFDNDGTLWCERPCYVQLIFAKDRVHELAKDHPEYKTTQPFKAALEEDLNTLATIGSRGAIELIGATHSGMTTDEFGQIVTHWITTARHPRFKVAYTDCVYQPMLEVLAYLRKNGFKTFIVSGGGMEFMRVWTERVYGIPPEQVTGSTCK